MRQQIEVIYENGVLRSLAPLPGRFREHQHFTVSIEELEEAGNWLADANSNARLENVRQALAKVSNNLAQEVCAERDER